MIVGTGLIAKAFRSSEELLHDTCIYAAGVSNSSCSDEHEYARDRLRLQRILAATDPATTFYYFSSTSIEDSWSKDTRYAVHKRDLEKIVQGRKGPSVIVRISQAAGLTPNPHTILNYLYARIARSEKFELWRNAIRNIIDVEDVARIVTDIIVNERVCSGTINVVNPHNSSMHEIVAAFEQITNHRAIYDLVDKGGGCSVTTTQIDASVLRSGIVFDDGYMFRTLAKYYG